MPTYDYVCTECTNEFEFFQKMSDPLLEACPKCKGKVERKIGGGAGLLFKGNGFYITDYKKSGPPQSHSDKSKNESSAPKKAKKEDIKQ